MIGMRCISLIVFAAFLLWALFSNDGITLPAFLLGFVLGIAMTLLFTHEDEELVGGDCGTHYGKHGGLKG